MYCDACSSGHQMPCSGWSQQDAARPSLVGCNPEDAASPILSAAQKLVGHRLNDVTGTDDPAVRKAGPAVTSPTCIISVTRQQPNPQLCSERPGKRTIPEHPLPRRGLPCLPPLGAACKQCVLSRLPGDTARAQARMDFQQLADVADKWCSNTPFDLIATEETERRMDFYADPGVSFYVLCPDNGCGDNFHVWSESEDCLPFLQLAQDYISSCGKKTLHEILEKVFKSFRPLLGLPDVDDDTFEEYNADVEEEEPEADHQQMGVSQQ
ncbi:maturin [Hyla sarda]|nr:maturin [Hyla sarda]